MGLNPPTLQPLAQIALAVLNTRQPNLTSGAQEIWVGASSPTRASWSLFFGAIELLGAIEVLGQKSDRLTPTPYRRDPPVGPYTHVVARTLTRGRTWAGLGHHADRRTCL